MNVKPIPFNSEMVQAIIEGRKTQIRRIIKPQPTNPRWNNIGWLGWDDGHGYRMKPPCQVGDILWMRETWMRIESCKYCMCDCEPEDQSGCYLYKATHDATEELPWKPAIHMPKEAARIFLRIKDVRTEKLWDMDEEAAIAEGFKDSPAGTDSPLQRFSEMWDKMIKRDGLLNFGWHANPWVWVIEFERCDKPEGWM